MTTAIQAVAQRAIDETDITRLNRTDFDRLILALDNPTEPNDALRDAAARHRNMVEVGQEELPALRAAWDQGKASGIAGPFDLKATIQRARSKKAAASNPD